MFTVIMVPGNEHLLLYVGQELWVIFPGVIQAFSVQTQHFQTAEHVEEDVWLLKLTHLLQETSQQTHETHERHTSPNEPSETCTCRMVYRSLRETGSCRYENFLSALFFNAREQNTETENVMP